MKRGVESCLPTREILTSHHRPPLRFMNWLGESVETPMISFGKDTSQKSTMHQSKGHLIFYDQVGNHWACQPISNEKN